MDDVTLLLANASEQTPGGTLSALGIGWSMTTSPTPPCLCRREGRRCATLVAHARRQVDRDSQAG